MAKLGLRRALSRNKRVRPASSKRLNGVEALEDRRVFDVGAIGAFVRTGGFGNITDASSSGATSHEELGYVTAIQGGVPTDADELIAKSAHTANLNIDGADIHGVGQSVSQTPTYVGGTTFVPFVNNASAHLLSYELDSPPAFMGGGGSGASAESGAIFEFDDVDDGITAQWFHGFILVATYGVTTADSETTAITEYSAYASITVDDTTASVGGEYKWEDSFTGEIIPGPHWHKTVKVPGYPELNYVEVANPTGGFNIFVHFVVPISEGATVSMSATSGGSTYAYSAGDGSANANWAQVSAAWGIVSGSPDTPDCNDLNQDGKVDEDDLKILIDNLGRGPGIGSTPPVIGPDGDLDHDGDVDEDDLALWSNAAADYPVGKTFVVSSEGDTVDADKTYGNLTLREALAMSDASVGDDDTILFAPGIGNIALAGTPLVIADEVAIKGSGADKLTINGGGSSRVFSVDSGVEATISGLTITGGGNVSAGGGILNNGDLTLNSVVVSGNTTTANGAGGGIRSTTYSRLQVINSTIDDNHASYGSGIYANVVDELLKIEGSTISNNIALGIATSTYSEGGGLAIAGSATGTVEIVNSTFSGNEALYSGGIRLQNNLAPTTITNSTIAYNRGNDSGGLHRLNNTSDPVLHNTIISENTARTTSTKLDIVGSVDLTNSTYNLIGSGGAGGLGNTNGNIILSSPNTAGLAPLGDYGGKTKTHALKTTSPAIDKGSEDYATTYDQRGLGFTGKYDLPDGTYPDADGFRDIGAYEASTGTTLIVRSDGDRNDSVDQLATTDSLRLREALALSAALAGDEVITFDQTGWTDDTITLSSPLAITSNVDIAGPGASDLVISANGNSAVLSISSSTVNVRGVTISDGYDNSLSYVGGIYATSSDVSLDDVRLLDNQGIDSVGGIWADGGSLSIVNSTLDGNGGWYGAVFADGADLTVINSTISNNSGSVYSGGIWFQGAGDLTVLNSTISGNQGYEAGGIVTLGSGVNEIIQSTIYNNLTFYETSYGGTLLPGGLRVSGSADVLIHNTIIAGNRLNDNAPRDVLVDTGTGASIIGTSSHNFIGLDSNNYFSSASPYDNIRGTVSARNARLAPLADNGGPTKTHVPYYDSEVIDHGDNSFIDDFDIVFDQRGSDRINPFSIDELVDIGAVELRTGEYYS
ncbi:choice-of-anchor Q domain-containing protein [Lacipirellula parvula]|nr:choice-of-anchor Q domain-containing protein [Lacipirellula parvula]